MYISSNVTIAVLISIAILAKRQKSENHSQNYLGFYREDTGEKLLIPEELAEALKQERLARQQAQSQVERLKEHLRRRVGVASRREAACR